MLYGFLCGDFPLFCEHDREVYGDPLQHPQTEEYWGNVNPIGERACYDEGKRVAETLAFDYWRSNGVEIRVIRIFNTYGTPSPQLKQCVCSAQFAFLVLNVAEMTMLCSGVHGRP
jgi:UDP-glucuronate decarboxylase